jgi:aryl-alcohol dehydrogenase-like predicted oxidoreductase
MEYQNLGTSGLKVSRIGLGMMSFGNRDSRAWHLDEDAARPLVRQAADAGVVYFDTADMYDVGASEEVTGRLLAETFPHRDDCVLATKVFFPMGEGPNDRGLSRKHVLSAIDASLRRLGTDFVDLYQIHRWDPHTPIEETMAVLDEVVRSGRARSVGASSMFAWQFAKAQHAARDQGGTPFVSMQSHYNLVYREEEREMIPLCLDQGVGVVPWSPLARGFLTGNRGRDGSARSVRAGHDPYAGELYDESDFDVVDAVREVADGRGVPPAQVALAWLQAKPGVTAPIVGATRPEHLADAVAAVDLVLTDDEMARLEAPYLSHAVRGHH